jgi:hypothetical protein
VKTTLDITDALFARAKAHARRTGQPFRAVVEEGLRRLLDEVPAAKRYTLPDHSVGKRGDADPLAAMTWHEMLDAIYGGG